jgi:hypothetical protein
MLGWSARGDGAGVEAGGGLMTVQDESPRPEYVAPNAILDRMRRRISRVGLLVAVLSTLLTALAIGAVYAFTSLL